VSSIVKNIEYRNWLRDLKQQIKTGQIKAALPSAEELQNELLSVEREMIAMTSSTERK
jgi:phage antirepressor YoqD-like protein